MSSEFICFFVPLPVGGGFRFYAYPRVRLCVTLVCFAFGCLHGCCGLCALSGGVWFVTTGVSKVVRGRDKIVWACDC